MNKTLADWMHWQEQPRLKSECTHSCRGFWWAAVGTPVRSGQRGLKQARIWAKGTSNTDVKRAINLTEMLPGEWALHLKSTLYAGAVKMNTHKHKAFIPWSQTEGRRCLSEPQGFYSTPSTSSGSRLTECGSQGTTQSPCIFLPCISCLLYIYI